jgi:zinc transport system substrate-binding protein
VVTLVQPGDDPHTYQPSDAQVSRVMQADVYFRIGVQAENGPWFDAIRSSGKVPVVDVREGIELRQTEQHGHSGVAGGHSGHDHPHSEPADHDHAGADPHIWLSPRLLKMQARTVARALADLDPGYRSEYDRNLATVDRELEQLDATIRKLLEPMKGKAFFVFHPAWGYFADEYGLEQVAIEVEGKEPSDAELTALQAKARQSQVKVVFVQPQIATQAARALAEAVGARLETLDPMAKDVPENLLRTAEAIAGS